MHRSQVTLLNIFGMMGMATLLLMTLFAQVYANELPCPLCLLQRIGFIMIMFGFMLNVFFGTTQRHYGFVLLGAVFGAIVALRQIALHAIPGSLGYGPVILGFHLYTWAFILFMAVIFAVGILLTLWDEAWSHKKYEMSRVARYLCIGCIIVVGLNLVSTFIECGFCQCPENPVHYLL